MNRKLPRSFNLFSFNSSLAYAFTGLLLCLSFSTVKGQVSIVAASPYVEPFTGFTGVSTPVNWFVQGTGARGTTWNGINQVAGVNGGWYGNANMSFLGSGSATAGNGTWQLQNNSGATITGFTLSFTAKLWKTGTASPAVNVYWLNQASGTNPAQGTAGFSNLASLNFNDATAGVAAGVTLSQVISSLNIPNGDYIYIRFIHAGGSNSDNLGWDDVTITPTICALASISPQPTGPSICAGNNTSLSLTASGATGYQWWEYNGAIWTSLLNGGVYSGVTTNTLAITGATAGMNGYQYYCVVSGACSSVNSNTVVLNVGSTIVISSQPSNAVTCIGNNALFSVAATGGTTYQWQISTDGGLSYSNLSNAPPYSTVTTTTMNITNAAPGLNGYYYQCIISNGGCTAAVTSNAAMLTAGGPTFIVNPGNASACTGGSAPFSVVTTGGAPTYMWEVSINGGATWNPVPNAPPYTGYNAATLTINPAAIGMNNYQYHCIATDAGCPATSSAALLTVSNGPVINTQPSNVITPAGTNANFTLNAANVTGYQWEESTDGGATWTPLTNIPPYSGVTTAAMIISGVTVAMNGYMYHCVLNGCSASLTSNAATLFIGASSGTSLLPGDMVIIGYDSKDNCTSGSSNASTDKFYITNLVDLSPGTKFKIVNSRYESGAASNVRTNRWYGSGDDPYEPPGFAEFQWLGGSPLVKGSIITFYLEVPTPTTTNVYKVSVNGTLAPNLQVIQTSGTCNISSSDPDQIYMMQGDFITLGTMGVNMYSIFTGKVLFGLSNKAAWVALTSACSAGIGGLNRVSRLPDDIECFNIFSVASRDVYFYKNGGNVAPLVHSGSQRQILGAIMNTLNWIQPGSSTICLDISEDWISPYTANFAGEPFTISGGNPPGFWIGDFDMDWFNCRNWESLTVPDATVDVTIPASPTSQRDCYVDVSAYPTTAAKYLNVAQCKNLTVAGRNLVLQSDINDKLVSYGNFLLNGTGIFDMNDGNNATADGQFYLIGNWTNSLLDVNFDEGNSTVYLLGSGTQTITTSLVDRNESFYNVQLDNPAGYTIDGDVTVKGNMNMINGVVNPTAIATDEVVFTDNATVTNLTANSYVAGKVRKIGDDVFVFPTGKNGKWARIAMAAPSFTTSAFQAEYFKAGYGIYTVNLPLDHVSYVEYWNLNTLGAPSNVNNVTLYWEDAVFSGITGGPLSPNLRVAYYTPVWDDEGAAGLFTAGNTGHLTSSIAPIPAFGPFTFGSLIPDIPLPVELISFTAKAVNNKKVDVSWITASEINNDYFTVMRSKDGINFEAIGKVKGNGSTTLVSKYKFTDERPFAGVSYYKLLQTDYNGRSAESKICAVNISSAGNYCISEAYTLDNSFEFLLSSSTELGNISVELYDVTGRLILKSSDFSTDKEKRIAVNTSGLEHAVYLLKVSGNSGNAILKLKL